MTMLVLLLLSVAAAAALVYSNLWGTAQLMPNGPIPTKSVCCRLKIAGLTGSQAHVTVAYFVRKKCLVPLSITL